MQTTPSTHYSTAVTSNHHKFTLSWGSIFAGTVSALSTAILFNLLGLALGFSAFTPNVNTMTAIGAGSIIWLALTGVISMFIGGWVAGKTTRCCYKLNGELHGFVTWGTTTLLMFLLATTAAGAFVTAGTASILNKDSTLIVQQNSAVPQNATPNVVPGTVNNVPVPNLQNPQNQQNIKIASNVLGSMAFATFCMFLLSAIAGIIGGCIGTRKHDHTDEDYARTTDVNTRI